MIGLKEAQNFSTPAFVLYNHIKNENNVPITFDRHPFLAHPYVDITPKQVAVKCGQVGFSTMNIIRSIHLARFYKANVIYTLPSRNAVKDFVAPKVNPLIENNPIIKGMIGKTESTALKSIGDRFIYFRGSWEQAAAISISAHILMSDEVDRSNQTVLRTYRTRLDAAMLERPDLGWEFKFSNPSVPGVGVDEWWQESDQKHWFIKCSRCNYKQFLDWPDSIDIDKKEYVCTHCHQPLRYEDRLHGSWIKKLFGRDISGYWFNQMMAPWIPASKIISDSLGDQSIFHNFTLGKPFVSKDMTVTRESIIKCLMPGKNPGTNVAIGVDNGIIKTYVIGNKYGIFRIGTTDDWSEIENLRNLYGAYMVIDQNPYPTPVLKLVKKYRGKVFAHNYYTNVQKHPDIIEWGENDDFGMVASDRTKIIDSVVADINSQDLIFNVNETDLENNDYIKHWLNIYRTVEDAPNGTKRAVWLDGDKADHFVHATVLWTVAMQKTLSHGAVVKPADIQHQLEHPVVAPDQTVPSLDLTDVIKSANRPGRSWRSI